MNISGIWCGTIVYGKMYRRHAGKEIVFEMNIEQENDLIKGECRDISGIGINYDPATIEGSLIDDKISFIKIYQNLHYYANGQTEVDLSKKGKEIEYHGKYFDTEQVFTGTWNYKNAKNVLNIFRLRRPSGKWKMRRK